MFPNKIWIFLSLNFQFHFINFKNQIFAQFLYRNKYFELKTKDKNNYLEDLLKF